MQKMDQQGKTISSQHKGHHQQLPNLNTKQGNKNININQISLLRQMQFYYKNELFDKISEGYLNKYSVVSFGDEDRFRFSHVFQSFKFKKQFKKQQLGLETPQISRGIAAILGMAIGDALGASTQFLPFRKQGLGIIKKDFSDIKEAISKKVIEPRHGKIGVWTDDASMGLCLADSILLNNYQFNPKHIRHLFILWLYHGLNNGGRPFSIGLGGNISISMQQFVKKQNDYTDKGDGFNNGNGSLMRLAPIPVAFSNNIEKAIEYSGLQSLTTHNGTQAQECCKLMANIIVQLINRKEGVDGKQLLLDVCDQFQSDNESVKCLARGLQQTEDIYNKLKQANKKFKKFNKTLLDRNWNWRAPNHTYSPCRFKQQPGYIGSYCMDALAMALHTVLYSNSFAQVVIKNADMGGDCDTVGSIAGQIAGAIYGVDESMLHLYSQMQDFTHREVFLKAYKLAAKKNI